MKALILSDLQGVDYREWMNFLQMDSSSFDVILLLGDIDTMFLKAISERFSNKPMMGVLGNHDYNGDLEYYGILNLHAHKVSLGNVSVVGLEGCVKYKNEEAPMYSQEEALLICETFPKADILISHNSPKGIHDKPDLAHEGFWGLTSYIEKHQPRFAFHGHQHVNKKTSYGNTQVIGVYGGILFDTNTESIQQVLAVID